jgi:membrane associated rhomboid family serine protease
VLPLRDENPTELTPYFAYLFLAANVAAWFLVQGAGAPDPLVESVVRYGAIPCDVTARCESPSLGWPALVTSMFMHGGWGHLISNMMFLWVFGNNIEDSMGHLRFIAFYLICGVGAAGVHVAMAPGSEIPTVGASGAISGIMGAYIVLYPKVRVTTWIPPIFIFRLNAFVLLGYWLLIQVVLGIGTLGAEEAGAGGVAVWAHLGGFFIGLALIKLFEKPELSDAKRRKVKLPREEVARLEW